MWAVYGGGAGARVTGGGNVIGGDGTEVEVVDKYWRIPEDGKGIVVDTEGEATGEVIGVAEWYSIIGGGLQHCPKLDQVQVNNTPLTIIGRYVPSGRVVS